MKLFFHSHPREQAQSTDSLILPRCTSAIFFMVEAGGTALSRMSPEVKIDVILQQRALVRNPRLVRLNHRFSCECSPRGPSAWGSSKVIGLVYAATVSVHPD